MSGLVVTLALSGGVWVAGAAIGWLTGRSDTRLGCAARLDDAYDRGWDESALAGTGGQGDDLTVGLSSGRRAVDVDGPAPLPAPMMCPGGRRCTRGPEPHRWSADCEEDEGWTDAFDQPGAGEEWADTLHAMRRELAAEAERPATHTDQFRAVFSQMDGLERQCLLTWDLGRRFDRTRPDHLRSMGISDKRIRELLGAD